MVGKACVACLHRGLHNSHHAGDLWRTMENALLTVDVGGKLVVADYNDPVKAIAETRGLRQLAVKSCGVRHGCNEFVFENVASPVSGPDGGAACGVGGAATNQGYP